MPRNVGRISERTAAQIFLIKILSEIRPKFLSWDVFYVSVYCLSPAPQAEPQAAGFFSGLSPAPQADPHAAGFSSGLSPAPQAEPHAAGFSAALSPAPHADPHAAGFSAALSPAPHAEPHAAAGLVSGFFIHPNKFESAIFFTSKKLNVRLISRPHSHSKTPAS